MKPIKQISVFLAVSLAIASVSAQADVWGNTSTTSYSNSGSAYARGETLGSGTVVPATVVAVRPVKIESSATAQTVGMGTGAVVGAGVGSQFGKGDGKKLFGLLGAIGGAGVGGAMGQAVGEDVGGEVVVRLPDGSMRFTVQADGLQFRPGQPVFVLASVAGNGWTQTSNIRIVPAPATDSISPSH